MLRRSLLLTTLLSPMAALAQTAGDPIRPLVIITRPQAASPQAYQAAELIAQAWRGLGLQVELRPLPGQQQTQVVWYERNRWDSAMWLMAGRPERGDPDEFTYNLFHSANAASGYDFVGYNNPDYDRLAEAQRVELDPARRQTLVKQAQELINQDQPYLFLVYPTQMHALNRTALDEHTTVSQAGLGIRNFWTYLQVQPLGDKHDIIVNSTDVLRAISPLYISGAPDSWVTELMWDRLMRIGPDGLPHPWAAESVTASTPTTLDITIRDGMTFHDGSPVTLDDVVYSLQVPGTSDKVPMYRPFVANIAGVEPTGPRTLRITLKKPDAAFLVTTLSKLNIIPRRVWEPVLAGLAGKPQNAESYQEEKPLGSGPYRFVRAGLTSEVVLEANPAHWSRPKAERWIMRIMPNIEATLGALRRGEINLLIDYTGDPDLLRELAKTNKAIALTEATDIGFQYLGFNLRRPPFNDVRFRQALSAAVDRQGIVEDAWGGMATPANSAISPALPFWHDSGITQRLPGADAEGAKKLLADAGYHVINGRLCYPPGVKETTTAFQ